MATTDQERSHSDEIREIWKLFRETDRKFEETDRKFEETDRRFKQTEKMVNDLTGKWGKFVEGLVAPGAIRMFRERGVNIERTSQRVIAQKGGENMEIDVLCVNDEDVLAIEVKSTLSVDDVKEHIERLRSFKRFFPRVPGEKRAGSGRRDRLRGGQRQICLQAGAFRYRPDRRDRPHLKRRAIQAQGVVSPDLSFRSRKIAAPNRTTIYYNWAFKEITHGVNGPGTLPFG